MGVRFHLKTCWKEAMVVSRMLWEMPDVLRRLWKEPNLSLGKMAWARCLNISEERSYSESWCHRQGCFATRTERRSRSALLQQIPHLFGFLHGRFDTHPTKIGLTVIFLGFFVYITILELPIFQTTHHTQPSDSLLGLRFSSSYSTCFGVVGYIE